MSGFANSLGRQRPAGFSHRTAEIKAWTRRALSLDGETVISVNELACGQPGCPPKQTVILVLPQDGPPLRTAIHKSLADVLEQDIAQADFDRLLSKPERSRDPLSSTPQTTG